MPPAAADVAWDPPRDDHCPLAHASPCLPAVVVTAPDPSRSRTKFALVDAAAPNRTLALYPNAGDPLRVDNEAFQGVVLCRTRTPGDPYFTNGRATRAFEIQIQGRFKQRPIGRTWLGLEVTQPLQLSFLRRLVVSGLLRLVAAFGWTFHMSLADSHLEGDFPHVSYPLLSSMDCVIVTPPGEPLPRLGEDLMERNLQQDHKRLASLPEDIQLGHCYTMCYFSQYLDFERWAFADIPGFGVLDLNDFWPDASLRCVCYAHPDPGGLHLRHERQTFVEFEIAHVGLTRYGELPDPELGPATATRPARTGKAPV